VVIVGVESFVVENRKVFIGIESGNFMRKTDPKFLEAARKAVLRAIYTLTERDPETYFRPVAIERAARFESPIHRYINGRQTYSGPSRGDVQPIARDFVEGDLVQERKINRNSSRYRANLDRTPEILGIID
jgi:hypothetical protein